MAYLVNLAEVLLQV